ncbi:hypothetical protein BKA69DRAFT_836981 [Paraphysoderma sedebokerense]|nr:hypothetical protein BKA69DRAFT_836981 [Paraphysoderma sedebokerense]
MDISNSTLVVVCCLSLKSITLHIYPIFTQPQLSKMMALPSLIWPKILYFFFFVSLCSMSFLPIFLKSYLQFSTSQIGFLISLQPFHFFRSLCGHSGQIHLKSINSS